MKSTKLMLITILAAAATSSHAALTPCPKSITVDYVNDTRDSIIGSAYGGAGGIFIQGNNQTIDARSTVKEPAVVDYDATNLGSRSVMAGFEANLSTMTVINVAQCQASVGVMDQCPAFAKLVVTVSRVHGANSQLICAISAK